MGKRLIITHGERTTRHEVGEESLVVGRDPGCDMFFVDQKLSRRHARFEPRPEGVAVVDLGSRNGTWVNEERVDEQLIQVGDEVRLGGLLITLEVDPPPTSPPDESERTVLLPTAAAPPAAPFPPALDEERTVMLGSAAVAVEPPPEPEARTVTLRERLPQPEPEAPVEEKTVLLDAPAADVAEAGTRIFRPPPAEVGAGSEATVIRPAIAPQTARPEAEEAPGVAAPGVVGEARWQAAALPWGIKFVPILAGLGLLAYLVLAVPLVNALRTALREESLLRGRALVHYVAAMNAPILAANRPQDLSTDLVLREPGVKDALILDLSGRPLAPSTRSSESFETIPGINRKVSEIFTFYRGRNQAGDYNLVLPLMHRGRRVGIAVLTYSPAGVTERGSVPALLVLGFLVIAGGVFAATLLARRITLSPLVSLTGDVESVIQGESELVPRDQAYRELADLAQSVNRLIERTPIAPAGQPTASFWPPQPTPLAPAPAPARPVAPSPDPAIGADLSVDANFIVTRADPSALAILGSSAGEVEGKPLIEALRDKNLRDVVLDLVNRLPESGAATRHAQVPGVGPVSVSVRREAGRTVVSFANL